MMFELENVRRRGASIYIKGKNKGGVREESTKTYAR